MHYMKMSLEELEELDRNPQQPEEGQETALYSEKIGIYSAMDYKVKRLVRAGEEDQSLLDDITKRLVSYLIRYGTYLKMSLQKDDRSAIQSLEKALNYEPGNPVAAYRLGFLSYRHHDFNKASEYFHKAIRSQRFNGKKTMSLTERQMTNAHLYLTNSALHIAKEAQEDLEKLPDVTGQPLPGYEFSSLYANMEANDSYLQDQAFYKETASGKTMCSKRECEELAMDNPKDTLILYFSDVETTLNYNNKSFSLTKSTSDYLRYFFTESSETNYASAEKVNHFFDDWSDFEDSRWSSYRRLISRIREVLRKKSMPEFIVTVPGKQSYYFNGLHPYMILYRVDEEIE